MSSNTTDRTIVTSRHVSFRWEEQQKELLLTTQSEQIALTTDKVLELLELLYDHRDDILDASCALPGWARDPGKTWPRSPSTIDDVVKRHEGAEDVSTYEQDGLVGVTIRLGSMVQWILL